MARQEINLGALPNGVGGDTPRVANTKINDMTRELYTKTEGIQPGATKNDTDANLKNRANHTGTQLAATIGDFSPAVKAVVGAYGVGSLDNMPFTGLNLNPDTYRTGGYAAGQFNLVPFGAMTGTLITQAGVSNATGSQQFSDWNSGRLYGRCMQGGAWGSWRSMLSVGDYGVGSKGEAINYLADANVPPASGKARVHPETANGPGVYGTLEQSYLDTGSWTQTVTSIIDGTVFARSKAGWLPNPTEWTRQTPELITNANGQATKFPDGTMICRTVRKESGAASNAIGGGLFSSNGVSFQWPVAFVGDAPTAIPSSESYSVGFSWAALNTAPTLTGAPDVRIVSTATGALAKVTVLALGRWK